MHTPSAAQWMTSRECPNNCSYIAKRSVTCLKMETCYVYIFVQCVHWIYVDYFVHWAMMCAFYDIQCNDTPYSFSNPYIIQFAFVLTSNVHKRIQYVWKYHHWKIYSTPSSVGSIKYWALIVFSAWNPRQIQRIEGLLQKLALCVIFNDILYSIFDFLW